MGLVLALSLVLAVVVPVWLLRSLVRESAHRAVEGEVVQLGIGILDSARIGLDEHLAQLAQALDGSQLSPDGTRFRLPFRPVPLGQAYLVRPQGPGARVFRLASGEDGTGTPAGADYRIEAAAEVFRPEVQSLGVLRESPARRLWLGQPAFLPQAPAGLWLVGSVPGTGGAVIAALPLAPGYLQEWISRFSAAVASSLFLVTPDNQVLPAGRADIFGQPWVSKALSRSKEGVFFTFPSRDLQGGQEQEVLVHVYADPVYLYSLVAVMPRSSLTATVDEVINQTTIFTALVAVVLGLVSLGLLGVFARQLKRLTGRLESLAEGNYRDLPAGGGSFLTETDKISREIETLAVRLAENQRVIEESRQDLEQRVADRTASLSRTLEELRSAQATLIQTEKMAALGRTVAAFTHEINNPLGAALTVIGVVESSLEEIRAGLGSPAPDPAALAAPAELLAEAVQLIHQNLQRAINITGSVKHVAADQSHTEVRDYDLAEYLAEVAAALKPMLRHGVHEFELRAEPGIGLRGDPAILYQICSNLVINSVKHGFEGRPRGKIVLEARRDGEMVQLDYRDDGNGMDAEQLSRLYEPFYTTKKASGGTGLGMSIVYNLVRDDLGGQILCESRPGEGVRFTVRFPAAPKEAS